MRYPISLILLLATTACVGQFSLAGIVTDSLSGEALPYATIRLIDTHVGTTTGGDGEFHISIAENWMNDTLQVSFIGYGPKSFRLRDLSSPLAIALSPAENQLSEVVVRPITAADQIRRSARKLPLNYASVPFGSRSYYRQLMRENSNYLDHAEGVFISYHDPTGSKKSTRHQLALYRETKDLAELAFMRDKIEKKKKKALKKNPALADSIATQSEFINNTFGGPQTLLTFDVYGNEIVYLDTNKLYQFKYAYGPPTSSNGRVLISVEFQSKGAIDHAKRWGTIYIDQDSDAIVSISEEGRIIIPALVKPLLVLVGMRVKKPSYRADLRYQEHNAKWYPELVRWDLDLGLVKTHLFSENERSDFFLEQLLHIHKLDLENAQDVPAEKRFDTERNMDEQVFSEPKVDWSVIDVIR